MSKDLERIPSRSCNFPIRDGGNRVTSAFLLRHARRIFASNAMSVPLSCFVSIGLSLSLSLGRLTINKKIGDG